ncbi:hypothetical protein [Pseudanabaena sp. PCC 6802]|uniref:hypothetical protein n=1 Tax=Pseudanabaena sp. PCC 6802 TaxID=118173 RepID=UPI00034B5459|nr:hypothetical protein [Pseudanabaena sp. PCC 6802]
MNRIPDWLLRTLEVVCSFFLWLVLAMLTLLLTPLGIAVTALRAIDEALFDFLKFVGEASIDAFDRAFGYEQEGENDE